MPAVKGSGLHWMQLHATPTISARVSTDAFLHLIVVETEIHELGELVQASYRLDVVERQVKPLEMDQVI